MRNKKIKKNVKIGSYFFIFSYKIFLKISYKAMYLWYSLTSPFFLSSLYLILAFSAYVK